MTASSLARFPKLLSRVSCQVHFGAKRNIHEIYSWDYVQQIVFGWNFFCPLLARVYGYVPAKDYKFGSDDETIKSVTQSSKWLQRGSPWVGVDDGFDYGAACNLQKSQGIIPPTWHIAGGADTVLGNPKDVKRWAEESGQTTKYTVLSKKNGHLEDYDHKSMLVSKNCEVDVYPHVVKFIQQHQQTSMP